MEFIPLEKYSKKGKKKGKLEKQNVEKIKKIKENEKGKEKVVGEGKWKPRTKILEKKNVKNKYKETLALKQKKRVPKRKTKSAQEEEDDVEKGGEEEEIEMEVEKAEEDEEKVEDIDEKAFKKKCQELDERNKNRLFVKLKKKILNEAQIKDLHPDIKSVVFPRKKNSRWCWAVFASEERAQEALQELVKKKEVFVTKPIAHKRNALRQKERLKTILRKKEARKKLQKMWT